VLVELLLLPGRPDDWPARTEFLTEKEPRTKVADRRGEKETRRKRS